jgi:CheY-like chemotaxis protein
MIRILVVDDEPGICDIIEKTFSYIGFSVSTATNAKKALSILEKEKPRIVFLDLIMPDMDGLELLTKMKQISPDVIVIVVTARKEEDAKEEAVRLGADEFIAKPFSRNYLRDVVVQKIKDVLDKGGHMKKPRILIVDDEKDARDNLSAFISRRFDCDIEEAGDGREAIEKVKAAQPDVILLDIKMPGISGIDAIGEIKKLSPNSRIIVVSAWISAEVVNQAVRAGASDYIGKPVSLAAFGEKLKTVLISMGKLILKKP